MKQKGMLMLALHTPPNSNNNAVLRTPSFTASLICISLTLILGTLHAYALTEGNYTYSVSGGKATITDFNTGYSGALTITNTLGGCPVISVGDSAFLYCDRITSVTIPASVTSIGRYAFQNCFGLASINIPSSVTSIGNTAFAACTSLTAVTIPNNVTRIEGQTFSGCTSLISVTIGNSVTSIGFNAFTECKSLPCITIPASVTLIQDMAFTFCTSLATVNCNGTAPNIEQYLFYSSPATIYYLPGKSGWTNPWAGRPTVCSTLYFYPYILANPTNLSVAAGGTARFSVSAGGADPKAYQWRKDGSDILGATDSTLTFGSVSLSDSGRYSVRISNAYNSITSASAKMTVLGGEQYSQSMCRMPDPVPFEKLPGQDSLIVITHGWQPLGAFADVSWMERMATAIRANLAIQGKTNWRVETFNWSFFAWPDPESALVNGNTLGGLLGMQLGVQSWAHIHLIGHSAGSAVIQSATEWIKCLSEETTVHATFLDPYIGRYSIGRLWYGLNADWADNYFSDDWTGNLTGGRLLHAHNVNVTQLDPDHTGGLPCFYSGSEMPSSTPAVVSSHEESSHPYPHDFYLSTIELRCSPEAEGYGFTLSKEGGGWDNHAAYIRGNDPKILGDPAVCLPDTVVGGAMGTAFNFSSLTRASSATGATVLSCALQLSCTQSTPNGLGMFSFSQGIGPLSENANTAWLSAAVTVTDIVNFVTFDISFTSPVNARGLLTVYWETNVVGTVDERTVMAAPENYRFPLPADYSAGTYALGFRLDSFTNITSSVIVTNVAAGFSGNTASMTLDVAATTNGMFMTLSAPSQHNYLVQASTNLVDWSPFAILANTNGAVRFYDPDRANHKQRFYRAVKP